MLRVPVTRGHAVRPSQGAGVTAVLHREIYFGLTLFKSCFALTYVILYG
jgi:hypothetical protein